MSASVPRGTRQQRLPVRACATLELRVADSGAALQPRRVRTTTSELDEMLATEGPPTCPAELDARPRHNRRRRGQEASP